MLKIILCCSAAMSSSLLVEKMKVEAHHLGIDADILSMPMKDLDNHINADIILLAPQVKYALKDIEKMFPSIPVIEVSVKEYGLMDGKHVLDNALKKLHIIA
ncbi:MAG: PTS sugar transporter subunit IIB [Longibaculum sp.]